MKQAERRDLFPGALEMMILRTLKRQPMHGYALTQHIKRASTELLEIEEGSLYPALQRMLGQGRLGHVGNKPPHPDLHTDAVRSQAPGA
jgi:hypothetical protein